MPSNCWLGLRVGGYLGAESAFIKWTGELSQWLCPDDTTINIDSVIIIIIVVVCNAAGRRARGRSAAAGTARRASMVTSLYGDTLLLFVVLKYNGRSLQEWHTHKHWLTTKATAAGNDDER